MATNSITYETFTGYSPFSSLGPYRANDYWQLPEGEAVELLRGRLIVSPSPSLLHQFVVGLLYERFAKIAEQSQGFAMVAPMDTVLSDDTIPQPDVIYVRKENRNILKDRVRGVPDLVIEVLSPSTSRRDRLEKLDLYAKHKIAEYWIVDAENRVFDFFVNQEGTFSVTTSPEIYQSVQFAEVVLDIADFWRVLDERLPT